MLCHKLPRMFPVALTMVLLSLILTSTAWTVEYKVLYRFQGGADGRNPYAGVILDVAGNLYGTTDFGGAHDVGTVFKLTRNPDGSWTESVIHSFGDYQDGASPTSDLIFDQAGYLYGTSYLGGSFLYGSAFELTPNPDGSWSETVILPFNDVQGASPWGGLIFDAVGNLYGTTIYGGNCYPYCDYGTAFMLTPKPGGNWAETVLHQFTSYWTDGAYPYAGLTLDPAGNLYGTTKMGGAHDSGTVFKLTPNPDGSWSESIIYSFSGRNGRWPYAALTMDLAGSLYGTTSAGGAYDYGTVFKLSPDPDGSWTRTKLHTFKYPDGANPYAGLILDAAGNLYGTSSSGGRYGGGTVFKLSPRPDGHWRFTRLHAFRSNHNPRAGLVMDADGNLYGTTVYGGRTDCWGGLGCGVVFRITP